jgi:hypothetical protein
VSYHAGERASEGDTNNTDARNIWQESLPPQTRDLLAEDARWFLCQSLSTPCLNAVRAAYGVYLEDVAGCETEQWWAACRILTDAMATVMENYRQGRIV